MEKKLRLLIFHQALAPYRVDTWNALNEIYELEIYFMYENLLEQKFDQKRLKELLNFEPKFLKSGVSFSNRAFRWGLGTIIRSFKPDVVFTYEYSQITCSVFLIKRFSGLQFKIFSMCDDSVAIAQSCKGLRRHLRNYLAPRLDGLILVSSEVAQWYKIHCSCKKIIVLPIVANEIVFRDSLLVSLPTSNSYLDFYSLHDKKCMFFIGRLAPEKGIDKLLQAFASLSNDFMLIIIGEGTLLPELKELCCELGIEERVMFPGRFEGRRLYAWYNLVQVFVLPSIHEPFGAVVNEALISGAYVLCSKYAGATSLINKGVNGKTFDPLNSKEFSRLLKNVTSEITPSTILSAIKPSKMESNFLTYLEDLAKTISLS
jgi:glycosyltransferase involved in cell wall biosynthesis